MKKKLIIIFIVIIFLGLSGILAANQFLTLKLDSLFSANAIEVSKYDERFIKDLERLKEANIFPESQYNRDASAYTHQNIEADPAKLETLKNLTKIIKEKYKTYGSDPEVFRKLQNDQSLLNYNATWIEKLSDYDSWSHYKRLDNIRALKGIESKNGIERVGISSALSLNPHRELETAVLAYLAQKASSDENQKLNAMKIYHKIIEIMQASHDLVSQTYASNMLQKESSIAESLGLKDKWHSVSSDIALTYKRVSWGWNGYVDNFTQPLPQSFKPYLKSSTGFCSAVVERISSWPLFREFFVPAIFLEKNYDDLDKEIMERTSRYLEICHMKSLAPLIAPTPESARDSKSKIPFYRRYVGYVLYTIMPGNFFKMYDKMQVSPNEKN